MNRFKALTLFAALFASQAILAQTPPPPQPPPVGPGLPLDGNILVLVAVALVFGVYFLVRRNAKNNI